MKTVKVSEATPIQLDWLVAKCEGLIGPDDKYTDKYCDALGYDQDGDFTTDWAQGGPIIEREHIRLRFETECYWHFTTPTDTWIANYEGVGEWLGPTPLIAACRCYVARKLGDTVEVPEESV